MKRILILVTAVTIIVGCQPSRPRTGQMRETSTTVSNAPQPVLVQYNETFGCYDPGGTSIWTPAHIKGARKYDEYGFEDTYKDVRVGMSTYRLKVPNGKYHAILSFCEIQHNAHGQRVFGIKIQGMTVTNRLDIFAVVGKNTAYQIKSPDVPVTNSCLVIEFDRIVGEPCVAALSIGGYMADRTVGFDGTFFQHINCGGRIFEGYNPDFGFQQK